MAIEVSAGRVVSLKSNSAIGTVTIEHIPAATPPREIFLLWWVDESHGPAALWSTQLLAALASSLTVRIAHDEDGAYIEQLEVVAAVP
jgi:hypothetical protein